MSDEPSPKRTKMISELDDLSDFITDSDQSDRKHFCRLCNLHVDRLKQHISGDKHEDRLRIWNMAKDYYSNIGVSESAPQTINSSASKVESTKTPNDSALNPNDDSAQELVARNLKRAELKLSVFIATGCALRSINCIGQVIEQLGRDVGHLHIHPAKYSKLITEVISPYLLDELVKDVGNRSYSLIIDESTDRSVSKYRALCIRYFSPTLETVTINFLGLFIVPDTTLESVCEALIGYLRRINLSPEKMVGIGYDETSNMIEENRSLSTLLRAKVPISELVSVKCIYLSLHSCISKASSKLPKDLEFLVSESHNWFTKSSERMKNYKDLFGKDLLDDKKMVAMIELSDIRWLAWQEAVVRIVDQWDNLKSHFKTIAESKEGRTYWTKELASMYKDETNHLYLIFLKTILYDVNETNNLFQNANNDIHIPYQNLWILIRTIAERVIKPNFFEQAKNSEDVKMIHEMVKNESMWVSVENVNYGSEFQRIASYWKGKPKDLSDVKYQCNRFIYALCTELITRMPHDFSMLKKCAQFVPEKILSKETSLSLQTFPTIFLEKAKEEAVESQLRKIRLVKWNEHFSYEVIHDTIKFWANVLKYKDVNFRELAEFALKASSLPMSNEVVEKVFSVMNAGRAEITNQTQLNMLSAHLRIRMHFRSNGTCCSSFEPTPEMLKLFTTEIYDTKEWNNNEPTSTQDADALIAFEEITKLCSKYDE